MRISDWSSDGCSSDLDRVKVKQHLVVGAAGRHRRLRILEAGDHAGERPDAAHAAHLVQLRAKIVEVELTLRHLLRHRLGLFGLNRLGGAFDEADDVAHAEDARSEEHTSELQSLMRTSYAVFC